MLPLQLQKDKFINAFIIIGVPPFLRVQLCVFFFLFCFVCFMNCSKGFLCYAATYYDVSPTDLDESDLPGVLLQLLKNNIKFCDTQNLGQKNIYF